MATLNAMFRILDGYSSQVRRFIDSADRAAGAVLGASRNTDQYNNSLGTTRIAANSASMGLERLIGTVLTLATAKKSMDFSDIYTNTAARLAMVNDGLQTQAELQDKVMAAANRARGNYTDMAGAVAKMNLLAGDSFKTNDEAIGFTELLQKSLKASGAGAGEQQSAFLQLTQALASGKLQGDEFRSVMENAPMVANAIADYMGKSKGELKDLSSKGLITADIIKNAMFAAADDINEKFGSMPMTFADVWNRIKNSGMSAFSKVFERMNSLLNSDMGQQAINSLTGAIYMAAEAVGWLMDGVEVMMKNWDLIRPLVLGVVAAMVAYNIVAGITNVVIAVATLAKGVHAAAVAMETGATFAATAAQYGFNAALLACPITLIVIVLIALIAILFAVANRIAKTSDVATTGFGVIAGGVNVVIQFFKNLGLMVANVALGIGAAIGALCENMMTAFDNAISSVQSWWYGLLATACEVVAGICAELNKLPFVEFDYSGITSAAADYAAKSATAAEQKGEYTDVGAAFQKGFSTFEAFGEGWVSDAFDAGAAWGDDKMGKLDDLLGKFSPSGTGNEFDTSGLGGLGTGGNPATVKGTGAGGAVKVENEEDIEWMRRLAERDYVARIAQNTLAPNIKVEFTGPITKEADVNGVAAHLGELLKEQIATAPEGVYA